MENDETEEVCRPVFGSVSCQLYKRDPSKRVFVNRSIMLEKVVFFGFDMDYTLAVYKSPQYEILSFEHLKKRIVQMGYPESIMMFKYNPTFPIRPDIRLIYPTKFVSMDESRFRICNTLYELPLIYILACLIEYFTLLQDSTHITRSWLSGLNQRKKPADFCRFETKHAWLEWLLNFRTAIGVKVGDVTMTFESMYNDVTAAMDYVHGIDGPLKNDTLKSLDNFVDKDDRLPVLLTRLHERGKKVFLVTNSEYSYTNKVMTYLFDTESNVNKRLWMSYFDFIIVDAKKPLFFARGTVLREVNVDTGGLKLGTFTGKIKPNTVYSGGSVDILNEIMGTRNSTKEVVYIGDHIFGDILKSKKNCGWHTFLVVPELLQELTVWTRKGHLFQKLSEFNEQITDIFRDLDSSDTTNPDISSIRDEIRMVTGEMERTYGMLGSVFRSGSRQTFFANQVMRYADLYGVTFSNLIYYPLTYSFRAPLMHMPHEATVAHEAIISDDKISQIISMWGSKIENADPTRRAPSSDSSENFSPRLQCSTPSQVFEVSDDFLWEDSA